MSDKTREAQYQGHITLRDEKGLSPLGLRANAVWHSDPKRLGIVLARYKFVAKMLAGKKRALEIGCGDAWATRVVRQEVDSILAVDFDPVFVEDARRSIQEPWPFDLAVHDILAGPVAGSFDAAFALDVLEHIWQSDEDRFIRNIVDSIAAPGVLILGLPSLESQLYASVGSKQGHVNCKTAVDLKALCAKHFHDVFIFSMNDEVVHTGFYQLAHYLFAVCVGKRA
jgi:SAM-dependent methyltransferase